MFIDWCSSYFCLTILCFCEENNLPPKEFFLLDILEKNVIECQDYLNTSQYYISFAANTTVKAFYLHNTFMKMLRVTSNKTFKDYCQSFDILKGIDNIKSA